MKKVISFFLITILTLQLPAFSGKVKAEETQTKTNNNLLFDYNDKANNYEAYMKTYSSQPSPDTTVTIPAATYTGSEGEVSVEEGFEGSSESVLKTGDTGYVEWEVDVAEAGLYNIGMKYYPIEGKSSSIERELMIDGKVPFNEAKTLTFKRVWKDKNEIKRDTQDNDIRPTQVEAPEWQEVTFRDSEELYTTSLKFYFEKGKHTIRLNAIREPLAISYLKLFQEGKVDSYDTVKNSYPSQEKVNLNDPIKIQAEKTYRKSDPTLYPIFDRSNPLTEPFEVSKIRLNIIGGNNWNKSGQWMSWKFEVPQDGLYKIGMRYRQNVVAGLPVTRTVMIDGKVPFKELERVTFTYDTNWQMKTLGSSKDDPYMFYLTKGEHEVRMLMTVGDIADVIRNVQQSSVDLTQLYTKIVMITGPNPDAFRDYQLEKVIPELLPTLEENAKLLRKQVEEIKKISGKDAGNVAAIERLAFQIESIIKKPETMAERLKNFKDNVSGIATWVMTVREQPMDIDYIVVNSPDKDMPKVNPNILQKVGYGIKSFFSSFFTNYNILGDSKDKENTINIWMNMGRDQANTLKSMIDDTFTPETGIKVNINLINQENVLLFSVAAGNEGPDLSLNVSRTLPVDYGVRDALIDLSTMPNFDEIKKRFSTTAVVPYSYGDKVYGLPQAQSFPMMFYRKDILAKLNLTVPETWDDLYKLLAVIEEKNLQFAPGDIYNCMLLQNGGSYYDEGLTKSLLDSNIGIEVFKKWTNLYTQYGLPQQYDFFNRFRNGEMPIGIADYTLYNQLSVAAQQIKGLWDIAPVPGVRQPDGSINRSVNGAGSAAVIFKSSKKIDKAWKFLDWWTSTETQVRFGKEMEALLGAAARYNTANVEAMGYLAWPTKDYNKLMEQWKEVKEVPVVPGSYFTSRHLDNAFKETVIQHENPREAISKYVKLINEEIAKKRSEFGLDQ